MVNARTRHIQRINIISASFALLIRNADKQFITEGGIQSLMHIINIKTESMIIDGQFFCTIWSGEMFISKTMATLPNIVSRIMSLIASSVFFVKK